MRDIEFRGKRESDGKWIYGYLSDINEISNVNEVAMPREEVDEFTIGQWTGLYDTDGHKVYEGDIIRDDEGNIGYITFLRQEMGYVIVWEKSDSRLGHRHRGGGYDWDDSIEVIGNMIDNDDIIKNAWKSRHFVKSTLQN